MVWLKATPEQIRALVRLVELDATEPGTEGPEAAGQKRTAARRRLAGPLLERYDAVLERGRRPAVAPAERGCCSGCHVRLPTVLEHKIRNTAAVFVCPYCHRLLYDPSQLGGRDEQERRDARAAP